MKMQIKADKRTTIRVKAAQKGLERQFAQDSGKMITNIFSQLENGTVKKLNKGTVQKFRDAQVGNYAVIYNRLAKDVIKKIKKRYSDERVKRLVESYLDKQDKANAQNLYNAIEKQIGISSKQLLAQEGLKAQRNALLLESVEWMKRQRDDAISFYTANTLRVMASGGGLTELSSVIREMKGKRVDQAKFNARNQINNFNTFLTKKRAENLGITQGIWITAGDERVRPSHAAQDGKTFDLDKGRFVNGRWLLPGQDYNCRCTMYLVIPEG